MLKSRKNNGNDEIHRFDSNSVKHAKKLRKSKKLFKSKKSKSEKLIKSKKSLKCGNFPNFSSKKAWPTFLIFDAKTTFSHLQLAFIKALILWHFDPECHIWIKTDVLGYAIGKILS